jgi:small subunit ribosomal protein S20
MPQGTPTKVKKRKKSVLKRAAQSIVRAERNRADRTRVRGMIRKMRAALAANNPKAAGELLAPTLAALDRASGKGILPRNTANRHKSRLMRSLNQLKAAPAAGGAKQTHHKA